MLESVAEAQSGGRYSIFAVDAVRIECFQGAGGNDPFAQSARRWRPWRRLAQEPDLPFIGGWVGMISYEAGEFTEPTAQWCRRAEHAPMAQWSLFDTVLIHDACDDLWTVAGLELPDDLAGKARPALEDRLSRMESFVAQATHPRLPIGIDPFTSRIGEWNISREKYLKQVRRALEYIRAGDIFQVNLARRFRLATDAHPVSIYQRLCEKNPAAFAAYVPIRRPDGRDDRSAAVLSSSPELFLHLRGSDVTTRPIKGTQPRGTDRQHDAAASRALAESEKDRAELNMIIDLERNDLGRVCEYGSVRVLSDGEIESHPTVFHRTATIRGRLRPGLDAVDLLRATFPGGSVTGAPKVRAMQIINELEPDARGPYCGAIGYVGLDGNMQLNLAIRTLTLAAGFVDCFVGSAIVADSDPIEEYRELKAKAAGMMAALGVSAEEVEQPAPVAAGTSLG
jgi:para-aminobenzoate synthetase component 1